MLHRCALVALLSLGFSYYIAGAADPTEKQALDLMPASTVAYFELPAPQKLIDTILDHPLAKELQQHPDYQRALESPDMQKIREMVTYIEGKLGTKWRPALTSLTGEGVYVGVDLATQGVVVLVRSRDAKLLENARETFLELVRADAKEQGKDDPIKLEEYRGVNAYKIDDLYYATHGPWLVLTNKAMLGRMVLDNAADAGAGSLGNESQFKAALTTKVGQPCLWAYLDLTILRATGIAQKVLDKKSDNPVAELLIGGLAGALPGAPYVTAAIEMDQKHVQVTAALPYDPAKVKTAREFYFGPAGRGQAPPLLTPENTIFSLSTYRDFNSLWQHAPDLFDDNVNAKFAEAESGLTTLFSGKSFSDDILANLEPGLQVVVTRQQFGDDDIAPQIKLPAIAAVFRLKKPEDTARQFKITYQSLIGFLNIAGGQAKLEALEQNTEKIGSITVASATYLPPEKDEAKRQAAIHFNASPTVAFVGDWFVLSSTKKLAVELAQQIEKHPQKEVPGLNTKLLISGGTLRAALEDNRTQLVAQNMLEKGHDQAAAETEIDLLLRLLKTFRETSLDLTTKDNVLRLSWDLQLGQ